MSEDVRLAGDLSLALARLGARLREEAGTSWSVAQLSALARIVGDGPITTAELAAVEHVGRKVIAETVGTLRAAGLVEAVPDPADGRKTLLTATGEGRRSVEPLLAERVAWLAQALAVELAGAEREQLAATIRLLERLADAQAPDSGR